LKSRFSVALTSLLVAMTALACSGSDSDSATPGSSASNPALDAAPIGNDCKANASSGDVAYAQGRDFFCVAWRDTQGDEQSYRVVIKYQPSGEEFLYPLAANAVEYFVPRSDWPEDVRLAPGACICEIARKDFQVSVHAVRASGEVLVGRIDIQREAIH
jgi:hypothetical protein